MERGKSCADCASYHNKKCSEGSLSRKVCDRYRPMCLICAHKHGTFCEIYLRKIDKYRESCDNHIRKDYR